MTKISLSAVSKIPLSKTLSYVKCKLNVEEKHAMSDILRRINLVGLHVDLNPKPELGACAPVLHSAFRPPERNVLRWSAGARSAKILKGSLERGAH